MDCRRRIDLYFNAAVDEVVIVLQGIDPFVFAHLESKNTLL